MDRGWWWLGCEVASFVRALHHHYYHTWRDWIVPQTTPFNPPVQQLPFLSSHSERTSASSFPSLTPTRYDPHRSVCAYTHIRSHQYITQSNSSSYSISVHKVRGGEHTHHNFVASLIFIELTCCFILFSQDCLVVCWRSSPKWPAFWNVRNESERETFLFFNDFLFVFVFF